MFDIGFSELLLVGLVALVVLGPERLPGAARTAGLWIGRIKRSFLSIKTEVEREIGADEIRRQLHNENILDMERKMKQNLGLEPQDKPAEATVAASTPAPEATAATPEPQPLPAVSAEPEPTDTPAPTSPDKPQQS
ncbi:MAG TPA: Sec-independent protein translocase protein TatB [Pseudomonas sp.]|jgi:sec-independent protein translocase protein TatB|nr:Sec-independent protein translocase protein TatB [Pseudomonas sp.]